MSDAAWAVVSTKPQAEEIAEKAIREAGYEPWLPMYRKRLAGARIEDGRRIRCRSDGGVLRPVFQRYLFALVPYGDGGYAIDAAQGVHRLLRYAAGSESWGKPKVIRGRVVLQLREATERGEFDEIADGDSPFKIDDRVRTATGIIGTLKALDDKGRADLLMDLMGAERLVRGVASSTLERIIA